MKKRDFKVGDFAIVVSHKVGKTKRFHFFKLGGIVEIIAVTETNIDAEGYTIHSGKSLTHQSVFREHLELLD